MTANDQHFAMQAIETFEPRAHSNARIILVAEEIAALRTHIVGIARRILPEPLTVVEAGDGVNAVEMVLKLKPEMAILDIALPGINGLTAAQKLWHRNPATKILFWCLYHREIYIRELRKIVPKEAIHGYILKNEPDDRLGHAIASVFLYDNPFIGLPGGKLPRHDSRAGEALTDWEIETLYDIALGLTDKAIAQRRSITMRAVQSRVARLFNKLVRSDTRFDGSSAYGDSMMNHRLRLVFEATKVGLIEPDKLSAENNNMRDWYNQVAQTNVVSRKLL